MKIAMWSGPRNLSTAMMYAFGARADFAVWDEPFYAAYLAKTGQDHPMRDEILEADESDAAKIAEKCASEPPNGKPNFYMKHMAHHMIDEFSLEWTTTCANIHLIRHPARVVASYAAKRENPTLDDLGFRQQAELYRRVGGLVVDSADIRADPKTALVAICSEIGLGFDPSMLGWPSGGHSSDGVWAAHWYGAVHGSTGFAGPEGPLPELEAESQSLADQAMVWFEELQSKKLELH